MLRSPQLVEYARQNRQSATEAERQLRACLRRGKTPYVWRFQHLVEPFIVDFCCKQAMLVVELDGASHDGFESYDQSRDELIRKQGYEVVRITNDELLGDCAAVVERLVRLAEERIAAKDSSLGG